jgi:hypothetical protein
MRKTKRRAIVAAVVAAATTAAVVVGLPASAADEAAAENYGQYSMMFERAAGLIVDGAGQPASQWAWSPRSANQSWIRWDKPQEWNRPATNVEHFVREGDWVYLHGWSNDRAGVYYTQHVTKEWIGDGNCANMRPLPSSNGRQHYVKWTIPTTAYCLLAEGYITGSDGSRVNRFAHRQIWSPAWDCNTRYLGKTRCIKQFERWADDNKHPFQPWLERDNYLGKGKGMGLRIQQRLGEGEPHAWRGDLRRIWRY